MHGILHPRLKLVQPSPAPADADLEALTTDFLGEMHRAALDHFEGQRLRSSSPSNVLAGECRTVQLTMPTGKGVGVCSGSIVAHVSGPAFAAWAASEPGPSSQRENRVLDQLKLVLQDLSDQDVHGCLALTESQCNVYDLDLVQLVAESLDRTTFSRLRRLPDIHWEGTLVKSLDPPALVLVLSIDLKEVP